MNSNKVKGTAKDIAGKVQESVVRPPVTPASN
jgi:hypothetical protein